MSIQNISLLCLVIVVGVTSTQSLSSNEGMMAKIDELTKKVGRLEDQLNKREVKRAAGQIGCASGSIGAYGHPTAPGYPKYKTFRFRVPFVKTPVIVYGASYIDAHHGRNLRFRTTISHLDKYGFTMKINSWADTLLYGITIHWMACPRQ